ncbi:MAG TPA: holo-ACP synthase [Polyangiaceae bacterium]
MSPPTSTRVGLDLVEVSQIASSVERFGQRFLDRIFTPGELRYCLADPRTRALRLAARFAAKEAARKVLRVDEEGVGWRSIEVERMPGGWCELALHGEARALARKQGFVGFSVSMSHEMDYAGAVVVGERRRARGAGR